MIMFHKLMHDHFGLDTSNLFSTATLLTTTSRGNDYKIFKCWPQATSRVRSSYLFTVQAINDWNSLPNHMVNSPTLNDFKNSLDSS